MKEAEIQDRIKFAIDPYGRFFRGNAGNFYQGEVVNKTTYQTEKGPVEFMTLKNSTYIKGLEEGFSDLFGFVQVLITPEMVGQTIARSAFIEVKTLTGKVKEKQANFLAVMRACGALADVARSPEDAIKIIGGDTSEH